MDYALLYSKIVFVESIRIKINSHRSYFLLFFILEVGIETEMFS